jgi:hypothetical protein
MRAMTDDDLKRLLESNAAETRLLFEAMREENAVAHAETRRHFDVSVDFMRDRFDLLAEAIASVDDKLSRGIADLDERTERGFAETQAMIKFSHAELDHRVRALETAQRMLEEAFTGLQARVERLEGFTH